MSMTVMLLSTLIATAELDAAGAKVAYEKGRTYYLAQEYEAALPHFRTAYELSGRRPSVVLALAQCERALKLFDESLKHYREYLATGPKNAKDVEQTISLVEGLKRDHEAEIRKPTPPAPTPSTPVPSPPVPSTSVAQTPSNLTTLPTSVAPPPGVTPTVVAAPAEEDASFLESPVFWIVSSVAVVGGAVAVGVALSASPDYDGGTTKIVMVPPGG